MNATNRGMNRLVLVFAGLVSLLAAGALLVAVTPNLQELTRVKSWGPPTFHRVMSWTLPVSETQRVAMAPIIAVAVAALVVLLLIKFVFSRGGGRTGTVLSIASDEGTTSVASGVADGVIAAPLRERHDVIAAHTRAFIVAGEETVHIKIRTRRSTDLSQVVETAQRAVAEWDGLTGENTPVVLQLVDRGVRDSFRSEARVR